MRGERFPEWARPKEGRSGAGHRLPAPVPRGRELPGKPAGASGSGGLTGQRARASAGRGPEQARNGTGEPCWARGSAVSTVGVELERGKKSSREPDTADQDGRFSRSLCGSTPQQTARLRAVL